MSDSDFHAGALALDPLHVALQFLTSLGVGLLLGQERQRNPAAKAGLRTFALVALFGTVAGLLAQTVNTPWILAVGLALVGAMIVAAYAGERDPAADPGTTTVIAVILCFCLGAMIWYGYRQIAVALAIVATALLHFRAELHGFSRRLTPQDIASMLQFALLTFVILPLLPNDGYGPYHALNPYHIWLMVVLISGVSVAGYVALRLLGQTRATLLTGVLGGLVSSTATTLVYARDAKHNAAGIPLAALIIVLANLIVPVRLAVISMAVAPQFALQLLPPLSAALLLSLPPLAYEWRRDHKVELAITPKLVNPTTLRVALSFGALYAIVLLIGAWLSDKAGDLGLYALALVSGLTDVDAITLSSLRLANTGSVTGANAIVAICVAFIANMVMKLALIAGMGGIALLKRCGPTLLAAIAGAGVGVWLTRTI
jgi:uncharacterized membrane protein (DUF4010 family)